MNQKIFVPVLFLVFFLFLSIPVEALCSNCNNDNYESNDRWEYCNCDEWEECFDYYTRSTAYEFDTGNSGTDYCDGNILVEAWIDCWVTDSIEWDRYNCDNDDNYGNWEYYCEGNCVRRRRPFRDYYCSSGRCTYTDRTQTEDVSCLGDSDYCDDKAAYCGGCTYGEYDCDTDGECRGSLDCMMEGSSICLIGLECGCCNSGDNWDAGLNRCCSSHASRGCYNSDVYWYDSCGNREDRDRDCSDSNGWYNRGGTYSCCDGDWDCSSCQDQEYREYSCSGTSCSYTVTSIRTQKSGCSSCGSDGWDTPYCEGDCVKRNYIDRYCSSGQCRSRVDRTENMACNGDDSYCDRKSDYCGGCEHGEWDCDSDGECAGNLVCKGPWLGAADGCCNSNENWDTTLHLCCTLNSERRCYDNDVYFYDACGNRGDKAEECGSSGYEGSNYCYNDDVYRNYVTRGCSGSSCTSSTERRLQDDCASNEKCVNGDCVDKTCEEQGYERGDCINPLNTACFDNAVYHCDDIGNELCWVPIENCGADGQCIDPADPLQGAECYYCRDYANTNGGCLVEGQTRCDGGNPWECRDQILIGELLCWERTDVCEADEYCSDGECRPYCGNGICEAFEDYESCYDDCIPPLGHEDYCDWKDDHGLKCGHGEWDCDELIGDIGDECDTSLGLECMGPVGGDLDGCCYQGIERWDTDLFQCCILEDHTECYDDDMYWYDSCGVRGGRERDCGSDGYVGDEYCYNGNVARDYAIRGCREGFCTTDVSPVIIEECASNEKCVDGNCVDKTCEEQGYERGDCINPLNTACFDNAVYHCDDIGNELCWVPIEDCGAGGLCIDPPDPLQGAECYFCSDYENTAGLCTVEGQRECKEGNPWECKDQIIIGQFLCWEQIDTCDPTKACINGICTTETADTCEDLGYDKGECSIVGAKSCPDGQDGNVYECITVPDGPICWSLSETCTGDEKCLAEGNDASCSEFCEESWGDVFCSENRRTVLREHVKEDCTTETLIINSCEPLEICQTGECVPINGHNDYCDWLSDHGSRCNRNEFDCDTDSECAAGLECKGGILGVCIGVECGCCRMNEKWAKSENTCCDVRNLGEPYCSGDQDVVLTRYRDVENGMCVEGVKIHDVCEREEYCSNGECRRCSTVCDSICGSESCFGIDPDCNRRGNPTRPCCGNLFCDRWENNEKCSSDCSIEADCKNNRLDTREEGVDCGGLCSNDCTPECIPYKWSSSSDSKIDIVFIPDEEYGPNLTAEVPHFSRDPASFFEDMDSKITDLQNLMVLSDNEFRGLFNFYYSKKYGNSSLKAFPGSHRNFINSCPHIDVFAMLHTTEFQDSCWGSVFSAEGYYTKAFLHESGHAIFELADEYDGKTSYFEPRPYPNIWDSREECVADGAQSGKWTDDDCDLFTRYSGDWYKMNNDSDNIMVGGLRNHKYDEASKLRIEYIFNETRQGRRTPRQYGAGFETEAPKSVVIYLSLENADFNVVNSSIVQGLSVNQIDTKGMIKVSINSVSNELIEEYELFDPRIVLTENPGDDGVFTTSYLDKVNFTVVFPYYPNLRYFRVFDKQNPDVFLDIDLAETIINYCREDPADIDCANNDIDGDGILDFNDNCALISNPDQSDLDSDKIGDPCDLQTCGNGKAEDPEECDDGNQQAGDGCSNYCLIEECYTDRDCENTNTCTFDYCDPSTLKCIHESLTGECDDGNNCTINDTCQDGDCVGGRDICIGALFVRGNPNGGIIDISDAIFILNYLFASGKAPACEDTADVNDDGRIDIGDAINILNFLFADGPAPKPPYPEEGIDPTEDDLQCGPPSECSTGETEPCERTNEYGACIGTKTCSSSGFWGRCDALIPEQEICDGLDNDCSGQTDDGLEAPLCDLQEGVCEGSVKTCRGVRGWVDCGPDEYGPNYEPEELTLDDGLDNDCDGEADQPVCEDGTPVGECSTETLGYSCNLRETVFELIPNCTACGCPEGMSCDESSGVCQEIKRCNDGTPVGECSTSRMAAFCGLDPSDVPFFFYDCGLCPCPEGFLCVWGEDCVEAVCDDGTPKDVCSTENPGFKCEQSLMSPSTFDLYPACTECGCGNSTVCNPNTYRCEDILETETYYARRAESPIIIDGDIIGNEWDDANSYFIPPERSVLLDVLEPVSDVLDCSAGFGVLWDDENLYVAVAVSDDFKIHDSSNIWDDDSVELYLDGGNEDSERYDDNDYQLTVDINNDTAGIRNDRIKYMFDTINEVIIDDINFYTVEYAVPFSELEVNPKVGEIIGFDIGINDDDDGGRQESQLMWHGDGSGWRDPRQFGELMLVDY